MHARMAAAPISWGVSELPGWGHQMGRERVLAEAQGLGFHALEAGPEGWLPDDPGLAAFRCQCVPRGQGNRGG